MKLGILGVQMDQKNIKRGVIDYNMVIQTKSPEGEAILKPIPDKIRELRDTLFATAGSKSPIAVPNPGSTLVKDEAARVVIWDGSGARRARPCRPHSRIPAQRGHQRHPGCRCRCVCSRHKDRDSNGKPNTVNFLAQRMGVASANIWNTYDPSQGLDVRVTLGGDWSQNNNLP